MGKNKSKRSISPNGVNKLGQTLSIEARFHLALGFFQNEKIIDAKILLNDIILTDPKHAESWFYSALIADKEGLHQDAIRYLESALEIDPHNLKYLYTIGDFFYEQNYLDQGVKTFELVIKIKPEDHNAFYNLAGFLYKQKKYKKSLSIYQKVLDLDEDNINVIYNIGDILIDIKEYENAVQYFQKVIEFQPNSDDALNNLGFIHLELGYLEESLKYFNRAIIINPRNFKAYNNRGNALQGLKRLEEALGSYDCAIEIKPDYAESYYNSGVVLQKLRLEEKALASYESAIKIKSDYAEAYYNRGNSLEFFKRFDEALASYKIAYNLKPDSDYLFGTILHIKMQMCCWQNFDTYIDNLLAHIKEGKKSSTNFSVLAVTDSLLIQRKSSEIWINDKYPFNPSLGIIPKHPQKGIIKIGYFSADFHEHPVSYLTVELFELHNKNQFELIGFNFGEQDFSIIEKRISIAFDAFINVGRMSDKEVAELSRAININIAIDLTGSTGNERVGVFSYRAAPIQVSYIGYLGTMGSDYYDYLIADETIIPIKHQQYFTEKIVYLPSYQVNDSKRLLADKFFEKAELNLPPNSFVFCCLNNNYKINPSTFDGWMRILNAVPESVLLLYAQNRWAEANIKMEAEKRGVSQTRLVFVSRTERSEYLARYKLVDLFLDTLPYNAGATASDALWAGLPVLTCMGESFASRIAASLLNAIQLPELVTTSQAEYEAKAIELATSAAKLKAIKDKLESNRWTTALFNTRQFTKSIEAAYIKMYEHYQADLPPDHIYIKS